MTFTRPESINPLNHKLKKGSSVCCTCTAAAAAAAVGGTDLQEPVELVEHEVQVLEVGLEQVSLAVGEHDLHQHTERLLLWHLLHEHTHTHTHITYRYNLYNACTFTLLH